MGFRGLWPRAGPTVEALPTAWPCSDQRLGVHTGVTPWAPLEPRDASSQTGEQPGQPRPKEASALSGAEHAPQSTAEALTPGAHTVTARTGSTRRGLG